MMSVYQQQQQQQQQKQKTFKIFPCMAGLAVICILPRVAVTQPAIHTMQITMVHGCFIIVILLKVQKIKK